MSVSSVVTSLGLALNAKIQQGTGDVNLLITQILACAGRSDDLVNLTVPPSPFRSFSIEGGNTVGPNSNINVYLSNQADSTTMPPRPPLEIETPLNMICIMAQDPDIGEIVYQAIQFDVDSVYPVPAASDRPWAYRPTLTTGQDNAGNVILTIDIGSLASLQAIYESIDLSATNTPATGLRLHLRATKDAPGYQPVPGYTGGYLGAKHTELIVRDPIIGEFNVGLPITVSDAVIHEPSGLMVGDYINSIVNPNILINSDFRNPVNTRGQSSYHHEHSINGWFIRLGTLDIYDGFIRITRLPGSTDQSTFLSQVIANPVLYRGKTVTLSVMHRGQSSLAFVVINMPHTSSYSMDLQQSEEWIISTLSTVVPDETEFLEIRPVQSAGATEIDIAYVKLELGSVSTANNDPPAQYNLQFLLSTGLSPTQSNGNILHNWDFRNPINQRGQLAYTEGRPGGIFTVDRWHLNSSENNSSLFIENGFIRHQRNTVVQTPALMQRIEFPEEYRGTNLTFSAIVRMNMSNTSLLQMRALFGVGLPASQTIIAHASSWSLFTHTFTVPHNATELSVGFMTQLGGSAVGDTFDIQCVKLEIGDISSLRNDPPMDFGKDLAICQRYQINLGSISATIRIRALWITQDAVVFDIPTPSMMRINPTFENGQMIVSSGITTSAPESGFSFNVQALNNGIRVTAVKTNHGLTEASLILASPGSPAIFDANL